MKNSVSAPTSGGARLAELVNAVRTGNTGSIEELHRILAPGVRFLIQQRVNDGKVETHVRSVLVAAVCRIREDPTVASGGVVRLVRQLIVRRFPARLRQSREGPPGAEVKLAGRILRGMSPAERDALRRCYVLGEAPESFLEDLKLTRDQFQALQCRARAEFSARRPPTANVA